MSGIRAYGAIRDLSTGGGVGVGAATNAPNNADVKAYVDAVAQGLDVKPSARALASVAIGTLSGLATTIDGVAFTVDGMRAQLTAESSAINNGPWLVHSGAWTRPPDFAAGSSAAGAFTFIEQGSVWSDTGWVCTADTGSDIVGTNSLPWVQFSSAGVISVTGGLTKTGNVVSVANADGTLVVTTGDIRRAAITGDVGVSAGSNAATIANSAVTLAKMANLAANRLLGNDTGSGAPVALTVGGGVEFTGAGGVQRSALTGDVTASAGSGATTLATVATAGTTGDASHVAAVTIDVKGRVTSASSTAISINASAVASGNLAQARLPVATAGAVLFGRSGGGYDSDSVIVIDSTNHRLGVNQATPTHTVDVVGTLATTGDATFGNNLAVTSLSTLSGHVDANNGLAVNGGILTANATGTAFAVTNGNADLQHDVNIGATLTLNSDTIIAGGSIRFDAAAFQELQKSGAGDMAIRGASGHETKLLTGASAERFGYNDTSLGIFGARTTQFSFGSATASSSYTSTEQTMLQRVWDMLRALGLNS